MANTGTASADKFAKWLLVVDDDQAVREMLVRVLKSVGYTALAAADGRQALAITAAVPIAIVLLDLGLPEKDGWVTIRALRGQNPGLAVIIITARANQRSSAEAAGAAALFEKPLDFTELLEMVARLLTEPPKGDRAAGAAANFPVPATAGRGRVEPAE
jgi:DNA-binding response OmpR family regulator